jgi:hypothetical protein
VPGAPEYVAKNTRERERLQHLVETLSDDDLRMPVNEHWTIAGVLGHIAFWDSRSLWLADKIESGAPFTPSDVEPDDVTWVNDSTRGLIHAIAPREAARFALRTAKEIDARVARMDPGKTWPTNPESLLNPLRAAHRGEHLDQVEEALARRGSATARRGTE